MTNRVVVITGAGTGIGQALACGFSRDNFDVVGLGRKEHSLVQTMSMAQAGRFSYHLVDVSDPALVETFFGKIGQVDVLINNSAIYPREYFLDQSTEDWTKTILINLCGAANCCRSVLPMMLRRNYGRIINVGSLADWSPIAAASAYSASKGGLHALTKAIAAEIDRSRYPNVLVNELLPNATRTSMSSAGDNPELLYPLAKKLVDFPAGTPAGRMFKSSGEIIANERLKAKLARILLRR